MNRMEFMQILRLNLSDLLENEREDAIQYYEDYLNDAGIENEQEAMEELGSPERLAETIKAGLNGGGEYTENGYRQKTQNTAEPVSDISVRKKNCEQRDFSAQRGNSASKTLLIIILCVVLSPIIVPLAGGLLAAGAGILIALFAIWIAFTIVGIAFFFTGLIMLIVGVVKLFIIPAAGALLLGLGLLFAGSGLLLSILMFWLFAKLVPPFCRWVAALCRKPFERRGGAA